MKLLECSETTEKIISSLFTNRVGLAKLMKPECLHTTYIVKINDNKNSTLHS